jgi:peptidyl-prolyl cis-trans isomerase C
MSTASSDTGCAIKRPDMPKPKTISVDGVVISRAAIARETQNHPAAKPIDAWLAAARALVVRELLLAEARRLGLQPAPIADGEGRRETDDEALVRQVLEHEVPTPEAGDEECRRYFDRNPARFRTPDLHEVSHILLPIARADRDGAATRLKAEALIGEVARDPNCFGLLAKLHSACPSREVGGNLGQIGPGQTVPEFEAALLALPTGRVAPTPVVSRYGVHVVRVDRRVEGRPLPFDLVRDRIAAFLRDRVRQVAERQYIAILAGRARVEGVALQTAATPLVQ